MVYSQETVSSRKNKVAHIDPKELKKNPQQTPDYTEEVVIGQWYLLCKGKSGLFESNWS